MAGVLTGSLLYRTIYLPRMGKELDKFPTYNLEMKDPCLLDKNLIRRKYKESRLIPLIEKGIIVFGGPTFLMELCNNAFPGTDIGILLSIATASILVPVYFLRYAFLKII